jgi:Undecaprenyl-phosphate galactose phosphotransferase WbaP
VDDGLVERKDGRHPIMSDRNALEEGIISTLIPLERPPFVKKRAERSSAWKQRVVVASLILSDVCLALLIWIAAYKLESLLGGHEFSAVVIAAAAPNVAVWIGLRLLLGLYPGYGLGSVERLRRDTYSVFAALAILTIFVVALPSEISLSRVLLVSVFTGLLVLALPVFGLVRWIVRRAGLWGRPVVILSYKEKGSQMNEMLRREWGLGYMPVQTFDYRLFSDGGLTERGSQEAFLTDAVEFARDRGVDTAIFAMPHTRREQLAVLVDEASASFRNILVVPNLSGITNSAVIARDLAGTFAVEMKCNLLDPWARRLKRGLDVAGAVVGGLLISPLLISIALLVKLDSPGPILYRHRRLGAADRQFFCWKFRTMHKDSEQLLDMYLRENTELKSMWEQNRKLRNDPRVTRVGRFLRRTSLDELPQLWNVISGEMSLTGPRPIVDAEISMYGKDYELYRRTRPGMSGLWQVSGRSDTDYVERVAMDSYYVRNWSVWLDFIILVRTARIVLRGRGAY